MYFGVQDTHEWFDCTPYESLRIGLGIYLLSSWLRVVIRMCKVAGDLYYVDQTKM